MDEMEARLKATFLESEKIPTLLEPLRFTWGMPTGTVVDHYQIYCNEEYFDRAKNFLTRTPEGRNNTVIEINKAKSVIATSEAETE